MTTRHCLVNSPFVNTLNFRKRQQGEKTIGTGCICRSPSVLLEISNGTAVVDAGGAKREVSSQLLENLEPGDYVMVHAGVAIAKITDEDESETDQLMEELL